MRVPVMTLLLALSVNVSADTDPPLRSGGIEDALSRIEREIEIARERGAFEPPPPPRVEEPAAVSPEGPKVLESDVGEATFYGGRFHGRRTASGERFDQRALTAAHRTYPFGTIVRVTNLENGRSVVLRINDRGPFGKAKKAAKKVIDVSYGAAELLRFIREGRILAKVEVLEWGKKR